MSTSSFATFFALLTIVAWVATVAVWFLALVHRRAPDSSLGILFEDIGTSALWIAALVAIVTTCGSLYFSEVAHFIPCKLCWYQRIAMYPLSITLFVAAARRDARVWWYVVPQAAIGVAFALYHTQLQAFPGQHSSFCTITEPCTVRYVWKFGFISLPLMALSAFILIITLVLTARTVAELAVVTGARGMSRALVASFVVALMAAGCGGTSSGTGDASKSPSSTAVLEVAGPTPSASAKMVCEDEARGDIAAAIGRDASKVTKPSWRVSEHVLSCDYDYGANTKMTLTVKELSSVDDTTAYFDSLATRLGREQTFEIGQGAFDTTNGSVVVRKDYKVLLIDVSDLPAQFGSPPTGRESLALNIATVIMACWSGA